MLPIDERLARKTDTTGDCHEWTGATNNRGYGYLNRGRRGEGMVLAHRAAWEAAHGPIPAGLVVCHHCDNRRCVRIDHLFLGTTSDNARDSVAKGRHPLQAANRSPRRTVLRGEQVAQSRLSEADVLAIRADTRSQQQIADAYGVSQTAISQIRRRITWKHL